jgi:hypothetical protein
MWFILESLPQMPLAALHQAGDELAGGIQIMMPNASIETTLIRAAEDGMNIPGPGMTSL